MVMRQFAGYCYPDIDYVADAVAARMELGGEIILAVDVLDADSIEIETTAGIYVLAVPACDDVGVWPPPLPLTPEFVGGLLVAALPVLAIAFCFRMARGLM